MSTSQTDIRSDVEAIRSNPRTQVLIIGGGINGIGTFRDLALQGVDVVLVERGDYASGASSASSHMIHGGVRYLENGEFRLVKESVQERNRLLRLAPHYVKPLPTTIPIFSTFSGILSAPLRFLTHKSGKPKERGALLIKIGLMGYDSFSRDGGNVPRHKFVGRKKSLAKLPKLRPDVKYTATYYDAAVENPERLALDLVQDALATGSHARTANYVEAIGSNGDAVVLRDTVSGETFEVTAQVVVNTTGPWTDLTNAALGGATRFMGGTKGSHIVLDNPELYEACAGGEVFFENNDGRIVLIYPLNGRVLVGTTDLEADPSEPALCTEEEVDYFFELVGHVFPTITVERPQIVYRYSGIRPLPGHGDTAPGFVSRDYRIEQAAFGSSKTVKQLSLVGGKWTTFRALAEHLANDTLALLGRSRTVSTADLAIGGGVGFPQTPAAVATWVKANGADLGEERTRILLGRYGTNAAKVIAAIVAAEETDAPLATLPGYSTAEIGYLMGEHTVHLSDLVLRRSIIAFVGSLDQAVFDELSELAAAAQGWSPERLADERAQAAENLRFFHGIVVEASNKTAAGAVN
ncbi:glycerol-3-phosphate dehydrogenase/oxidase [Herbiconiux sp. KACC 21604]|uniref:glycerol-3-phosphate dehydrogenase/oxidase n=1 Tax=unclassified Herbiconiux TaxID=2618217 RepID=UPI001491B22E|nr:glycerol-3-phosphate dehydrogenase/oxidase [Herbiconiux sp. SALV-R1]QJU54066.1 glycerol-3-phosphate dehydrogenase/oxidase [Herbiconiux sp. SALV-R1]WPO85108.1 glycerol-3-phosphate dehydrogenase/oxidase [Herbiconiux sp. KACC 21604]